ncbi:MAG TPA: hypothetical protein VGN04_09995 [Herbaspirillum sp.]|jgi:hypothetical protein
MNLSSFFEDMTKAYQAELEDLQSDSEGNDMIAKRLKDKRQQFALMMPMIETAPEMVAVAFHGGINFLDRQALTMLALCEPDEFPAWDQLADAVQFSDWAQKLAATALKQPDGERFLLISVCLEYLYEKSNGNYHGDYNEPVDTSDDAVEGVERDDDEHDLESEGADWLADQGFDRLG